MTEPKPEWDETAERELEERHTLHQRGHRAIACHCWRDGSYLKLSDSLPLAYTVHGEARGKERPLRSDHIVGVEPYHEYFEQPVWVAVEESE